MAPMSSLKYSAAELQPAALMEDQPQNKRVMSVTPSVSHLEMWPYIASAVALSESHLSRAVLIVASSIAMPATASNKLKTHRSAADPIVVAQGSLNHATC